MWGRPSRSHLGVAREAAALAVSSLGVSVSRTGREAAPSAAVSCPVWPRTTRGIARARRLAQCDEQMPQALEIMALALRAGHALPGALHLASQETPAPLCHELRLAHEQHQLGRPIAEVLQAMGQRLPGCAAVETFVVAVAVLQETGGNLIQVIDRIVENARARAGYQAMLALEVMTLVVASAPPQTPEEAAQRANEAASTRVKAIAARLADGQADSRN